MFVVCDADTGFGGDINICRTVNMFEAAGVGAIHIEDQTFPKDAGAIEGKQIIGAEQFAKRIRTAVDARKNRDFVIIARTDSKVDGGIDEAIRRLNLYIENGADMAMVGDFYTFDQYLRLVRKWMAHWLPVLPILRASHPALFQIGPVEENRCEDGPLLVPSAIRRDESSAKGRIFPETDRFNQGDHRGTIHI